MQEVPLPFAEDAAVSGRSDPIRIGRRFHTDTPDANPSPGSFSRCTADAHAAIHIPAVLLLLHYRSAHPPLQTPVCAPPLVKHMHGPVQQPCDETTPYAGAHEEEPVCSPSSRA